VRQVERENGVTQTDTRVLWCETAICEERAADGETVTRRAFGLGEQISGAAHYISMDHLGSVPEVTDSSVTLLARYAFDPWGRRTLVSGTDVTTVGFTGHRQHGPSGLALTLYRGYDAGPGRWVSEDPIGLRAGPNRYAYVGGRAIDHSDRLGLCSCNDECPSGAWSLDTGTLTAGSCGLLFSIGAGRVRCNGKPGVSRWATVHCATWGAIVNVSVTVMIQITGAAVSGVCRASDLREFRASATIISAGPVTASPDSFGLGPSAGGGIGRAECRVVPW
jgi:RHS repeat-associated protein